MRQIHLLDLVILVLATFRISALLVWDKGPFGLFQKIRELVGIEYIETQEGVIPIKIVPESFLSGLFDCIRCISMYVAAALLVAWVLAIPILDGVIILFAIAGGVYLIHVRIGES